MKCSNSWRLRFWFFRNVQTSPPSIFSLQSADLQEMENTKNVQAQKLNSVIPLTKVKIPLTLTSEYNHKMINYFDVKIMFLQMTNFYKIRNSDKLYTQEHMKKSRPDSLCGYNKRNCNMKLEPHSRLFEWEERKKCTTSEDLKCIFGTCWISWYYFWEF